MGGSSEPNGFRSFGRIHLLLQKTQPFRDDVQSCSQSKHPVHVGPARQQRKPHGRKFRAERIPQLRADTPATAENTTLS